MGYKYVNGKLAYIFDSRDSQVGHDYIGYSTPEQAIEAGNLGELGRPLKVNLTSKQIDELKKEKKEEEKVNEYGLTEGNVNYYRHYRFRVQEVLKSTERELNKLSDQIQGKNLACYNGGLGIYKSCGSTIDSKKCAPCKPVVIRKYKERYDFLQKRKKIELKCIAFFDRILVGKEKKLKIDEIRKMFREIYIQD